METFFPPRLALLVEMNSRHARRRSAPSVHHPNAFEFYVFAEEKPALFTSITEWHFPLRCADGPPVSGADVKRATHL